MSIKFSFSNNLFKLEKLNLPTRFYYFKEFENYIKLLNIGEGFFPGDKIFTNITLDNSSLVLSNESATKIYPSNNNMFAKNFFSINLRNSNFEFINDELILFKNSKFIQFSNLSFDDLSTFFYCDLLSSGRSFENNDFETLCIKNKFSYFEKLEYFEKFCINGNQIKDYFARHKTPNHLIAKVFIRTKNNQLFEEFLVSNEIKSFGYSHNSKIMILIFSNTKMDSLKKDILSIWEFYRSFHLKKSFNLGKQ